MAFSVRIIRFCIPYVSPLVILVDAFEAGISHLELQVASGPLSLALCRLYWKELDGLYNVRGFVSSFLLLIFSFFIVA